MSVLHRYRNFGGAKTSADPELDANTEATEDEKLQAFEAGYQAGWDDATKAQDDHKQKTAEELNQSLQDMSFTYHEALAKLTLSLEPVMEMIVQKLLPEMVSAAVGSHIVEQVNGLLKERVKGPLEIVVSPSNITSLEQMMDQALPQPFDLVADDTLGAGQAFIRFADVERQIDLDAVVQEVAKAMAGLFHDAAK